MENKNTKTLLISLLTIPVVIFALLIAGAAALAEEQAEPVIITLDTKEILDESLNYVYNQPEVVANRLAQQEIANTLDDDTQETVRTFSHLPVVTATLTPSEIDELEENELVESIVPEQIHRPTLASSSAIIDTPEAYTLGYDGNGVAVAILDTGVDNDHSFLNVVSEACYSNAGGFGGGTTLCPGGATSSTAANSADTDQCSAASGCDHGTHVAGIAAGDGSGATYTGVAKSADIIAIQVFTQFSSGCAPDPAPCLGAFTSDIVAGLNRVLALHNDVGFTTPIAAANMSLGGSLYSSQSSCDSANASTKTAIDNLRAVGIATIIASGNEYSSSSIASPGCISTAVAVGSTTDADNVSSFSNSHAMLDLLAPGSSITSSIIGDGNFGSKSGTSMATPQVAGAWAVIKEKDPDASVADVLQALEETGTTINDSRNGLDFSRIDLDDALSHSNFNLIDVSVTDNLSGEDGSTATVEFSLSQAPTATVTIPVSISDTSEADLGGTTNIAITTANWNNPAANQVVITGVDDGIRDGIATYSLVTGDPTSADLNFDNLDASDVTDPQLENFDDEKTTAHDFDGDGESDIFTANGTNWRVSYSGKSSWDVLQTSSNTLSQIHFADFNCDQRTDVFKISGNKWQVSYSGTSSWTTLNNSSAPANQLLIADIDGDTCADIVRMDGSKWEVSYSGTGKWQQLVTSSTTRNKIKLGDFNGDGRTDAFQATGSKWRVSYGMSASWTKIANSSLTHSSLKLGDFIGNGGTDVFRATGSRWEVSESGNSQWSSLANSGYSTGLKLPDLNGDGRDDVFRVTNNKWYVSYSGTSSWKKIGSSSVPASLLSIK